MTKKNLFLLVLILIIAGSTNLMARQYVEPPSSSASSAPVISDEAMKVCVKLYNEAEWLNEEIGNMHVDQYIQKSVNAYNAKVNKHSNMTNVFNRDCAGKQSYSAWKAAQELNK